MRRAASHVHTIPHHTTPHASSPLTSPSPHRSPSLSLLPNPNNKQVPAGDGRVGERGEAVGRAQAPEHLHAARPLGPHLLRQVSRPGSQAAQHSRQPLHDTATSRPPPHTFFWLTFACRFSPGDGEFLATASFDGQAKVTNATHALVYTALPCPASRARHHIPRPSARPPVRPSFLPLTHLPPSTLPTPPRHDTTRPSDLGHARLPAAQDAGGPRGPRRRRRLPPRRPAPRHGLARPHLQAVGGHARVLRLG